MKIDKPGVYRVWIKSPSRAYGPVDENNNGVGWSDLERGVTENLSCYIPEDSGYPIPNTIDAVADIVYMDRAPSELCVSPEMYRVVQSMNLQPHKSTAIKMYNKRREYLGDYHLLWLPYKERIRVLDLQHSKLKWNTATDGLPFVYLIHGEIYILPDKLPEYDLFMNENHWMASGKFKKACKKYKGIQYEWITSFPE